MVQNPGELPAILHPRGDCGSDSWDFIEITERLKATHKGSRLKPETSKLEAYIIEQENDTCPPARELEACLLWELGRELCFDGDDTQPQRTAHWPDELIYDAFGQKLANFSRGGSNAALAIAQAFNNAKDTPHPRKYRISYPRAWAATPLREQARFALLATTGHLRATKVIDSKHLIPVAQRLSDRAKNPLETDADGRPIPLYVLEIYPSAYRHLTASEIANYIQHHILRDFGKEAGRGNELHKRLLDLALFRLWVEHGQRSAIDTVLRQTAQWPAWKQHTISTAWDAALLRHLQLMRDLFPLHFYPKAILKVIPVDVLRMLEKPTPNRRKALTRLRQGVNENPN